eukprot:TRINITY_DN701_c0_g1_i11.p1 TRINITY_DN701_c0_g1~~TRINITY_DN701_c0_g1_i11.p1  ORF type:complete len:396 (+),score=82.14 TRINITY_DN701_c0_g1_i11:65-1252(+)
MAAEIVVSVKMLSVGLKKFEINIRRDMTVDDLKEAIAKEDERENGDQYRLTYDNKELKDGNVLLGDLKPALEEWSVFTVVLKPSEQVAASSPDDDMVGSAAVPVPSAPPLSVPVVDPDTGFRYVKVQQPDGNVIHITLRELDTIYNLKDRLLSETDTPISRQKLLYNGSILQDERELRTFGTQGQTPESPILVTMIVQQNQPLLRVGGSNDANDDESDMIDVVARYVESGRIIRFRISKMDSVRELKLKLLTEFYTVWNLPIVPSGMTVHYTGDGLIAPILLDNDFENIQQHYNEDLNPQFAVEVSLSADENTNILCCSVGLIICMCIGIPGLAVMIAGFVILSGGDGEVTFMILLANGGALLFVAILTGCLIEGCCGLCNEDDEETGHTNDEVV